MPSKSSSGSRSPYYRALAPEYEDHALPYVGPSADELVSTLDSFHPAGDVLELACGPGTWTPHLVRKAARAAGAHQRNTDVRHRR
jgi:hypothetical protein